MTFIQHADTIKRVNVWITSKESSEFKKKKLNPSHELFLNNLLRNIHKIIIKRSYGIAQLKSNKQETQKRRPLKDIIKDSFPFKPERMENSLNNRHWVTK